MLESQAGPCTRPSRRGLQKAAVQVLGLLLFPFLSFSLSFVLIQ